MNVLLDTHVLIWYSEGNPMLSKQWIEIIENPLHQKYFSYISLWEMNIKISIGKLTLVVNSSIEIVPREIEILQPTLYDLNELSKLSMHHRDPFDRMIIAQAISNNFLLMSNDENFKKYPVELV
jgi:PIN domain nuclease of toxin-antitoxin system